ncbi:MAG: hypothetical protein GX947_09940, partial [Tissierellia bacterium]|nr:hypothetical protein [Tissierellia bacterium]
YDMARASTLNAHYTSPVVIKAMYEAIENMGFTTGNVLEPAMGDGVIMMTQARNVENITA